MIDSVRIQPVSMCNYVAKYENTPQDKGEEVPFNPF